MRKFFILFLCIHNLTQAQSISEQEVKTKVNTATVYPKGVQVVRKQKLQLPEGKTKLIFTGISPFVNTESIVINTDQEVNILSSSYRSKTPIKVIKDSLILKINQLQTTINEESTKVNIINDKLQLLYSLKDALTKKASVSATEFNNAIGYYNQQLPPLAMEKNQIQQNITKLFKDKNKLINELNNVNQLQYKYEWVIEALIDIKGNVKADFTISYFSDSASWTPSYDLKISNKSADIMLDYKANLVQNTKVNWDNITLNFSSTSPSYVISTPEFSPYYLYDSTSSGKLLVVTTENKKSTPPKVKSNNNIPKCDFQLNTPFSIPSGKNTHHINIAQKRVDVDYRYLSMPKQKPAVFLHANLHGWEKMNILPGQACISRDGKYLQKVDLFDAIKNDTLIINKGIDKGISISRKKIRGYYSSRDLKEEIEERFGWCINVKNNKQETVNIQVIDQMPVSDQDNIIIEVEDSIFPGKLNKETGQLDWNIRLYPREEKNLYIKYTVRHPKDLELNIQ